MAERNHVLDIYESDCAYADLAASEIADCARNDEICILIATQVHRDAVERRLHALGLASGTRNVGRRAVMHVDAERTLARFMVNGKPNAKRFYAVLGAILNKASSRRRRRVRIFGEMVALLLEREGPGPTLALEQLFDGLVKKTRIVVRCPYHIEGFRSAGNQESLDKVCLQHSGISLPPRGGFAPLTRLQSR